MEKKSVILIGAGLAGSLLAIYLARRGYRVDVYERRSDMRETQIAAGRSINLALSVRGLHALQEIGMDDAMLSISIPMKGRMVHPLSGDVNFQPYSRNPNEHINSISRGELNIQLMNRAEATRGVRFFFNHRCTGMDLISGDVYLRNEITGEDIIAVGEAVIGTDGSASAIRMEMLRSGRFNFSQQYEEHGYKELTIPPADGGGFRIEKNALHIWPRGTYMLIALPNLDGSFTVTLFYPMRGDPSFESMDTPEKVWSFFESQFPDALQHMPTLLDDYFTNPVGSLLTVKCWPWFMGDKACLLGDAAHAIVPFFGQGMNCAFEDCSVLDDCIGRHEGDWKSVFADYTERRKANADAIADLALENFIEMRDLVADGRYLLKKKIEKQLADRFPERFVPKYEMVSFHRIPYVEAMQRGRIQESILDELADHTDTGREPDWKKAESLIQSQLSLFHEPS
jgi:kynurenine 3-monooxygenase